jgi:hypothetical protein
MTYPNTLIFVDLASNDPAAAGKFYAEVFGWRDDPRPYGFLSVMMTPPTGYSTLPRSAAPRFSGGFWCITAERELLDFGGDPHSLYLQFEAEGYSIGSRRLPLRQFRPGTSVSRSSRLNWK